MTDGLDSISTLDDRGNHLASRAFARFLEVADRPTSAFVLADVGAEETYSRLPPKPALRDDEAALVIEDLRHDAEGYAYAWGEPADATHTLHVEVEMRDAGYVVTLERAFEMDPELGGATYTEPAREAGRSDARWLVGGATDFVADRALLLLEALVSVIDADGSVDPAEETLLKTFAESVPAFARDRIDALVDTARIQVASAGDLDGVAHHLSHLGAADRRVAIVLATELAALTGGDDEARTVAGLAARLEVGDAFVTRVSDVVGARFATDGLGSEPLALAMMAIVTADGAFDQQEMTAVKGLGRTLPALGEDPMTALMGAHRSLSGLDAAAVAAAVADACGDADRYGRTLVAIAAELAMSSQGLDPREDRVLRQMAEALGVDEAWVTTAVEVYGSKYTG